MEGGNFMMAVERPWYERALIKLGFGWARVERPDDAEQEGFAPGYMLSSVRAVFGWRDRLRILVSGQIHVEVALQSDVIPLKLRSVSAVSVLSPTTPRPPLP